MSLWEYKVITSGKGGFATPALLEKFLNDLGRDEWEIIHFQTPPENFLAFTGLARRSTQRDWTLEDAAAAAAKAEAEKLRAEFEAKFKAAASNAPAAGAEERAPSFLEEKVAPDDGFRKPVDTSHDAEAEIDEEEAKADEWDKLTAAEEEELPTFFDAIKPHMRRNQRGPGMSVGVDYLAKKWDQSEDDLKAALAECGFVVPVDEDAKPEYLEYDGDLYWLNVNRRGELWINTKEKPRPVFRPVKAQKAVVEEEKQPQPETAPKAEKPPRSDAEARPEGEPPAEPAGQTEKGERPKTPLPEGPALLDKIRPHMRRNRRGPGGSGSASFLSRALRTNETELKAAFASLGLVVPATPSDKPVYAEIGNEVWWLNVDSRGGLWINGREKKEGETVGAPKEAMVEAPLESAPAGAAADAVPTPDVAPSVAGASDATATPAIEAHAAESVIAPAGPAPEVKSDSSSTLTEATASVGDVILEPSSPSRLEGAPAEPVSGLAPAAADSASAASSPAIAAARSLLKETRTGAAAAKVDRLADELGQRAEEFVAALVNAGLRIPEKPREKPVFIEHAGEKLWLNKNAKGELWLNAKAAKEAEKDAEADLEEEDVEESEGGEGETEKKGRRGNRVRTKKAE